ncbi:arginase family protein [Rhodococcus opacus]|nr:arginase family protein [Rhodococcus opacus]
MVGASDTVLIGHRTEGLDAASAAELVRLPSDLRRIDAPAVVRDAVAAGRQAAAWLAGRGTGVWLHLDLDVLDPESLNAVTYPQPGGLDWDQLADVVAPLARSPRLVGVSVADFRPDPDPTGDQATRVLDLLGRTLP